MPDFDTPIEKASHKGKTARRARKTKPTNLLQAGILSYLNSNTLNIDKDSSASSSGPGHIPISTLPRKYTHYPPLLLFPSNFSRSTSKETWTNLYNSLTSSQKYDLFESICKIFQSHGQPVTHIAINAPIPPSSSPSETSSRQAEIGTDTENVMRSPSHLEPVYGDFGPPITDSILNPTEKDFEKEFWVTSNLPSQNPGQATIKQCWAPRWTMFSHGNLSEKNRVLRATNADQGSGSRFPGLGAEQNIKMMEVLDLYVGIGYFGLCYLSRGVRRVWGWDLNPWSIEGLRRGCEMNGWACEVLQIDANGDIERYAKEKLLKKIIETEDDRSGRATVRCIAFLGDNKWASHVLEELRRDVEKAGRTGEVLNIRHANLGLLPTSRGSWQDAVKLLDRDNGGWLHIHENVDLRQVQEKKHEVVQGIRGLVESDREGHWIVECTHIEQVKTYAPGIIHCVFDIEILPKR